MISGSKETYRVIKRLSKEKIAVIAPLNFPKIPTVKKTAPSTKLQLSGTSPYRVQQDVLNRWKQEVAGLAKLHQARIPFAISSQELKSAADVLKQLRLAIKEGLPRDAALAALTTNGARLLRMQNRLGKLQQGYLGHVVVMTGPFDNEKSKVRYLFVNNKKHEYNTKAKPVQKATPKKTASSKKPNLVQISFDADDEPPADKKQKTEKQKPVRATHPGEHNDLDSHPTELRADRLKRPASTGGNVLVKNVIILTGTGKELRGRSILIRKGKIVAIGKGVKPLKGMRVINGHGCMSCLELLIPIVIL